MNAHEIFLVGSVWFWLLIGLEVVLLALFIEWERGTLATLTLVTTLLLLQFLGNADPLGLVLQQPGTLALAVAGYFALGTAWSVAKWWFYVQEQRSWYDELRAAFLLVHGFESRGAMPEELQEPWRECLVQAKRGRRSLDVHPSPGRHKARILQWMSYWPLSLVLTVLEDPVRKAFVFLYHKITGQLQQISDHAFRGIEADLPPPTREQEVRKGDPVLAEFGVEKLVCRR